MKRVWEDMRMVIKFLMVGRMKYASITSFLSCPKRQNCADWVAAAER